MDRPEWKNIGSLMLEDIVMAGLLPYEALDFYKRFQQVLSQTGGSPTPTWRILSQNVLLPSHPHALHQLVYYCTYYNWDASKLGPPLAWFPTLESAKLTNLGRIMEIHGAHLLGSAYKDPISSFNEFQKFTVKHPEVYFSIVLQEMSLHFHIPPKCILDTDDLSLPGGTWLPGAVLNIAECCVLPKPSIKKTDNYKAVVWRDEGKDDAPVNYLTLSELRASASQVANALEVYGLQRGDAVAIDMPMHVESVIIYLGIILAGCVVVSIADSFVPAEIATRLRISKAKAIFTQDKIFRGGKIIQLYSRVVEAKSPNAIVIALDGKKLGCQLRAGDMSWNQFLTYATKRKRPQEYKAVHQSVAAVVNILFSSGTTAEPKAIPWTQASPIRCAADCWAHSDISHGEVFAWPTNLGWMMGPLLIFATLLNGASIALYNGSPLSRGFGKFVQDAKVTSLGTVPSMVKYWRKTSCMESLDWSSIRSLGTTGEASSPDDDLWLSAKAGYKPVLECCGGTELASGFLQCSLLQPQAFAHFSTPCMTTSFVILDDDKTVIPDEQPCIGELALNPTMLGASNRLLNADHNAVYFKDMPAYNGKILRRHGDLFERTPGGYYRALGRADDTMNLGGIKTSAVEIEQVCNRAYERVVETAAVALSPPGGGPENLIIVAVLNEGPTVSLEALKKAFSSAIQANLNPLFKVHSVLIVQEFPRTASNKIMRRTLRNQIRQMHTIHSSRL